MVAANLPTAQPSSDPGSGFSKISFLDRPVARMKQRQRRSVAKIETKLFDTFQGLCRGELRWPLFLWGDEGRGKSMAALCFCDFAVDAAWFDLDRICQALVDHRTGVWDIAREREFVVLDEVGGRDQVSCVDTDAVKRFADLRESYAGRVAVYITNHPPEKIKTSYGRRIFSRLCCGTIYRVSGLDRRME